MAIHSGRLGARLSKGNTSEVWEWSPTTVVKVLQPGIPTHWAAIEADITRRVYEAGLPVPATEGTVVVDGRPGIVFERIDGMSMWDQMKASPEELPNLVDALVDLQSGLHAAGRIGGIPDLLTRLRTKIGEVENLTQQERSASLDLLAQVPHGSSLCHGDLHPSNILMASRGMVVVDWFDAAIGHGAAGFVRSSLLIRAPSAACAAESHRAGVSRRFLDRLHGAYISTLVRHRLVDESSFALWEAVLAVARMSEPVPTADLNAIWRSWCDGTSTPTSLLVGQHRTDD